MELNEQGEYVPVEIQAKADVLTGGVFMLRQVGGRRVEGRGGEGRGGWEGVRETEREGGKEESGDAGKEGTPGGRDSVLKWNVWCLTSIPSPPGSVSAHQHLGGEGARVRDQPPHHVPHLHRLCREHTPAEPLR